MYTVWAHGPVGKYLADDLRTGRFVKTAKLSRDVLGDLFWHGMRPKPRASSLFLE